MSFLDQDYADTWEPEVYAANKEVQLRVMETVHNTEKHYIMCTMGDPANDRFNTFNHFLYLPKPDDDAKKVNNKKRMLLRFEQCFNSGDVTLENVEQELPGHEGWVILNKKTDAIYGDQNEIARYVGQK